MCGIAGIFGEGAVQHTDAVRRMVEAVIHRGPDDEGLFVSPSGNCVLGHRRLAVLDISDAASQPMVSADGHRVLVYNGECYNYRELRNGLFKSGESVSSSGDTEVVLRLLVRDGISLLPRMNAMFALAFWDEREQTLLLARDRYGQKPLYFTRIGRMVIFASEVRSLLASGLVPRKVDLHAIHGYLAYGAVQEPYTIVSRVSILRPGSYMQLALDGTEEPEPYWAHSIKKQSVSPPDLRASFVSAVERHLISDAPLGLFLSGGIDSSAVLAAAARSSRSGVKTLTLVFPEQPHQSEAEYAKQMAAFVGTDHTEIPISGNDLLKLLPHALDAMDQPTSDAINTYIVSYAAHQAGLKVALSGLGGDELFGGYPAFRDVAKILRLRQVLGALRGPGAKLLEWCGPYSIKAAKVAEILDAPADVLCAYLTRRRFFSSRQIGKLIPDLVNQNWDSGLSQGFFAQLQEIVKGRETNDTVGLLEMRTYMGQMLLRDSDVMGMAHSLEIRLPFLDADFSSCALALEPQARVPRDIPKWRFVEALDNWLPKEIVHRPKQGFTLPFRDWMLCELKHQVFEGICGLLRVCEPMQKDVLFGLWDRFLAQPEKIGWLRPWSLFVLGCYLERHRLRL